MKRLLYLALTIVCLGAAAPAAAQAQTVLDPDDSPGPLDVVAVRLSDRGTRRDTMLKVKIVTYEAWENSRLSGPMNFIDVAFTSGDRRLKRDCFRIRDVDGSLQGQLFRECFFNGVGDPEGTPVDATRPDDHSVLVEFPRRWLAPHLTKFQWSAITSYEDENWSGCEPPDRPPPEHPYGTCNDATKVTRHRSSR